MAPCTKRGGSFTLRWQKIGRLQQATNKPSESSAKALKYVKFYTMEEEQKALIGALVHEAAAPIAGVLSDLIGVAGGDALHAFRQRKIEQRLKNQNDTIQIAKKALAELAATPDPDTPPEKVEDLLEAAQDCNEPSLKEMYGRLLASLLNPARSNGYRRQFVEILKQLEPLDAAVLKHLNLTARISGGRLKSIARRLERSEPEIELAADNLIRLGCASMGRAPEVASDEFYPTLTTIGKELLRLVR